MSPGDAAGPHGAVPPLPRCPVETVGPNDLARALGASRAELYRARGRGSIPEPDRPTLGGFARWSLALAARIVREAGREVPPAWRAAGATAGGDVPPSYDADDDAEHDLIAALAQKTTAAGR